MNAGGARQTAVGPAAAAAAADDDDHTDADALDKHPTYVHTHMFVVGLLIKIAARPPEIATWLTIGLSYMLKTLICK